MLWWTTSPAAAAAAWSNTEWGDCNCTSSCWFLWKLLFLFSHRNKFHGVLNSLVCVFRIFKPTRRKEFVSCLNTVGCGVIFHVEAGRAVSSSTIKACLEMEVEETPGVNRKWGRRWYTAAAVFWSHMVGVCFTQKKEQNFGFILRVWFRTVHDW